MVETEDPATKEKNDSDSEKAASRRDFLRVALTASLVLVAGGLAALTKSLWNPLVQGTSQTQPVFPVVRIANVKDLTANAAVSFNYPLEEEPNLLVKIGAPAQGGVGPEGDIIAFSQVCQHLGCVSLGYVPEGGNPACNPAYKASGPVGYCCCHGSVFDFQNSAKVIGGPSPRPLPQVTLRYDSGTGDIFAVGMGPPTVFGHDTGSNDVSADLQGGTPVS